MRSVRLDPELDAWLQRAADATGRSVSDVIQEAIVAWRSKREGDRIGPEAGVPGAARSEFDPAAPAIEDVLSRIAAEAPEAEWDALPWDLSENLDRYLYGEAG